MPFSIWVAPVLAFVVTFGLIALMLKSGVARMALDHPNQRSLHASPVPRTGGLAVIGGILSGWMLLGFSPLFWIFAGIGGLLLVVSFVDDLVGLSVGWRFLTHFLAAFILLAFIPLPGGYYGLIPVALFIVWMINLYNFMDGADGLAGGMAFFGFGFYGLGAWLAGDLAFAVTAWVISLSALAFLFFNFSPAKIFMGDGGSIPLGFFAAGLGLFGWAQGYWAWWFPLLVFSPFILDASTTLAKRIFRREQVWQAHREHYYQRLVRMGYSHRGVAWREFALMGVVGVSALWGNGQPGGIQIFMVSMWGAVYLLLMRWVDIKWANYSRRFTDDQKN